MKKEEKVAFTLAEVVITLIVIGVVSAITIPMLNNDVNDKKWNTARQKAQATIGEAFKLATVNGYVTPDYDNTKDFVTKVLTKYLKINKQCDTAQVCGFSNEITRAWDKTKQSIPTSWTSANHAYVLNGSAGSEFNSTSFTTKYGSKFNNAAYFQTLDGFSVALYYNPYCAVDRKDKYHAANPNLDIYVHYSLDMACMNAVYDMNGKKGPNKAGQDIGFISSFWNGYSVKAIAILPYNKLLYNSNIPGTGSDYWLRGQKYCRSINDGSWKYPDEYETALLYLNKKLLYSGSFADFSFVYNSKDYPCWHTLFDYGSWSGAPGGCGCDTARFYSSCVRVNALK